MGKKEIEKLEREYGNIYTEWKFPSFDEISMMGKLELQDEIYNAQALTAILEIILEENEIF